MSEKFVRPHRSAHLQRITAAMLLKHRLESRNTNITSSTHRIGVPDKCYAGLADWSKLGTEPILQNAHGDLVASAVEVVVHCRVSEVGESDMQRRQIGHR